MNPLSKQNKKYSLVSAKEVREHFNISQKKLCELVMDEKLKYIKSKEGKYFFILNEKIINDVNTYIKSQSNQTDQTDLSLNEKLANKYLSYAFPLLSAFFKR
jgi:hypothetical protein